MNNKTHDSKKQSFRKYSFMNLTDYLWYIFEKTNAVQLFLDKWSSTSMEDAFLDWNISDSPQKYSLCDISASYKNFAASNTHETHTPLEYLWAYTFSSINDKNVYLLLSNAFRRANEIFVSASQNRMPHRFIRLQAFSKKLNKTNEKKIRVFPPFYVKRFTLKDIGAALTNVYFWAREEGFGCYLFPSLWDKGVRSFMPISLSTIIDSDFKKYKYSEICSEITKYIYKIHLQEKRSNHAKTSFTIPSEEVIYVRSVWISILHKLKEVPIFDFHYSTSYIEKHFPNHNRDILKIFDLCPDRFNEEKLPESNNFINQVPTKNNPVVLKYLPYILYSYITSNLNESLDSRINEFKTDETLSPLYDNHKRFIKRSFLTSTAAKSISYQDLVFIILLFRCCLDVCHNNPCSKEIDFIDSSNLFLYSIYQFEEEPSEELTKNHLKISLSHSDFPELFWELLCTDNPFS